MGLEDRLTDGASRLADGAKDGASKVTGGAARLASDAAAKAKEAVAGRIATTAHGKIVTKPRDEMTKRDVVKLLWRARGVVGDVEMPGSNSPMNVLLPGRRVKAFTAAAEEQLGAVETEKRGRFGRRGKG